MTSYVGKGSKDARVNINKNESKKKKNQKQHIDRKEKTKQKYKTKQSKTKQNNIISNTLVESSSNIFKSFAPGKLVINQAVFQLKNLKN